MPGIKIACPATPADAKGLLKAAIRDNNPVLFVESKVLYGTKGEVPDVNYVVPLGKARVARPGRDVTILAYSRMVQESLRAADAAAKDGVEAEVIDLRTLNPLDMDAIAESVEKTGRVVIVEECPKTGGVSAEIGFRIFERLYFRLDAPIRRVAARDLPVPASPVLERATIPGAQDILNAIRSVTAD
jgi:pyruvate/2-oxoglutarate/acetoin dehydrogenase E1 component